VSFSATAWVIVRCLTTAAVIAHIDDGKTGAILACITSRRHAPPRCWARTPQRYTRIAVAQALSRARPGYVHPDASSTGLPVPVPAGVAWPIAAPPST
jgi:hypothetical protein